MADLTKDSERVLKFLGEHPGVAYCDECIGEKFGLGNHEVKDVIAQIRILPGIDREFGKCSADHSLPRNTTRWAAPKKHVG
jgi:hypothetical protein